MFHQEKSIHLAPSGTSGMSGTSGGFSCQKSLSSHFSQNFHITRILSKLQQNSSEFLESFSQFINSFPPKYLHANSNFCSSSFKLRHMWHCWSMFNFLCPQCLSLTTTTYIHWTRKHRFVQQLSLTLFPPHLTITIQDSGGNRKYQSMSPLTIAMAFPTHTVYSCCPFFISQLPTLTCAIQHDPTLSTTYVAIHLCCS